MQFEGSLLREPFLGYHNNQRKLPVTGYEVIWEKILPIYQCVQFVVQLNECMQREHLKTKE